MWRAPRLGLGPRSCPAFSRLRRQQADDARSGPPPAPTRARPLEEGPPAQWPRGPPPPTPPGNSRLAGARAIRPFPINFPEYSRGNRMKSGQSPENLSMNHFLFPSPASWRGAGRAKNGDLNQGRGWVRGRNGGRYLGLGYARLRTLDLVSAPSALALAFPLASDGQQRQRQCCYRKGGSVGRSA